jgi:hypothetical protein
MIQEIKNPNWPAFCRRISEQRAGASVKVDVIETDGVKSERVGSATLQTIAFDKLEGCSDTITLRLRNEREIVLEIIEPIRILLHPSGGSGDFNPLQIEAESGVTFLTLHPPIHAKMLDGLGAG